MFFVSSSIQLSTYATDAELAAVKQAIEKTHSDDVGAINASLANKANTADVYTKNQVDTKLGDYNTKTEVDQKIAAIYAGSDSLADYITDNRATIPGLLSADDKGLGRLAQHRAASRPGLCAIAPGRRAGAPPVWKSAADGSSKMMMGAFLK